jgi:hypothetical protein
MAAKVLFASGQHRKQQASEFLGLAIIVGHFHLNYEHVVACIGVFRQAIVIVLL